MICRKIVPAPWTGTLWSGLKIVFLSSQKDIHPPVRPDFNPADDTVHPAAVQAPDVRRLAQRWKQAVQLRLNLCRGIRPGGAGAERSAQCVFLAAQRRKLGGDIDASCGQLRRKVQRS